ncbi:MAG: hypothetical protein HRT58_15770 [Crocinitomicaceae bacterium]|nr:hypothetical protein [Flavobacteriales bacterium]NQZ37127.1 hypothetical protein [Crocinitomicaceae bacterium]
MITRILLSVCMIFTFYSVQAQKVKLKKDVIYVDGEATFSFAKKTHGTEFVVYTLNTKDELFTAIFYAGNTEVRDDNYYKLVFTNEKKSMEYTRTYWNKYLIGWLLEQDILNVKGEMDPDKIDGFITKYDENISERTVIIH